jgi:hypothetical protein
MPLEDHDVGYVRREFVPLADVCSREGIPLAQVRDMVHAEQLPKPPYVLPDGTEMVSDDYFELAHDAGSIERNPRALHRSVRVGSTRAWRSSDAGGRSTSMG